MTSEQQQPVPDQPPHGGAERREGKRHVATFRTCALMHAGHAAPAILRNISDGGAMFETRLDVPVGSRITYWWDGINAVEAQIAWRNGDRMGVRNLTERREPEHSHRPRATRIPVNLPIRLWVDGICHKGTATDISLSGVCVADLPVLRHGALATLELAGETLPNATAVRRVDGHTGVRFERPLRPALLMRLLDDHARSVARPQESRPGQGTHPSLLKVANDRPEGEKLSVKPKTPPGRLFRVG